MRNETTVIDNALTQPWTVTRSYRRDRNPVWDFVDCAEHNPHVRVGKEYLHGERRRLSHADQGWAGAQPDARYLGRKVTIGPNSRIRLSAAD